MPFRPCSSVCFVTWPAMLLAKRANMPRKFSSNRQLIKSKQLLRKNQIHSVNSSGRKTLARHKTHPAKPYNVWHLSPSKRPCFMAQKGRLSERERRPFMKTPLNGCKFSVLPLAYLAAFTNFTASFPPFTIYVPSEMAAAGIICTYVSADLPL